MGVAETKYEFKCRDVPWNVSTRVWIASKIIVTDNIHSLDVARFIEAFIKNPRIAEVYNLGGGKQNSCSILEAFNLTEKYSNKAMLYTYVSENRIGDHICYYSDLTKMREHYPHWDITISLEETIKQIVESWQQRLNTGAN
ncbi:hypothetical protein MEO40_26845 [Dolichospermum sp. ST_sed1]|nr:hypothetical protein [Dolichospermum sp. ST_sed1]MDD1428700.1 hypothetical protein [Dolichospermum sp. ST_sed9]MDD1429764.1 hypothetical protein [Dolichospermum sp. ST_sed6]MDD1437741.1 hypothetical protein [Dolichospermum sp. ST_sed10]MDD1443584.1 hypothetical protein [Dolichospermum sp. ST_sed3]MDD1446118.1 hypothetical protein [Dolichospermum sp. ST_sed8]MDD1454577.1 hypothetical protein [Dolichospermum sp. ST_sed7]MDD1459608.1 hypothetical protein [Dolichospermum sp. ST_sed2]MDD14656